MNANCTTTRKQSNDTKWMPYCTEPLHCGTDEKWYMWILELKLLIWNILLKYLHQEHINEMRYVIEKKVSYNNTIALQWLCINIADGTKCLLYLLILASSLYCFSAIYRAISLHYFCWSVVWVRTTPINWLSPPEWCTSFSYIYNA